MEADKNGYDLPEGFEPLGCKNCLESNPLNFAITMAYQPIVNIRSRELFAYEALVRGADGAGAGDVLSRITEENRYTFDQTCRVKAIEIASRLNLPCKLSINFLPNAVYNPRTCIRATVEAADYFDYPVESIIFEVTESEPVRDPRHLDSIFREYDNRGFITAIDDFGSGYAGLNLLTQFSPKILKIDMDLCRGIAREKPKELVTAGIVQTARALDILVVAEGLEEIDDVLLLQDLGVELFQGFLFAKPEIETLPEPDFSSIR